MSFATSIGTNGSRPAEPMPMPTALKSCSARSSYRYIVRITAIIERTLRRNITSFIQIFTRFFFTYFQVQFIVTNDKYFNQNLRVTNSHDGDFLSGKRKREIWKYCSTQRSFSRKIVMATPYTIHTIGKLNKQATRLCKGQQQRAPNKINTGSQRPRLFLSSKLDIGTEAHTAHGRVNSTMVLKGLRNVSR